MFRVRNFEYTFRALGLEIGVENFRRFYQLTVNTGFFTFNQRYGSTKLMTPPNGLTKWKRKFFYVKAVTDLALPNADTVSWFPRLRTIKLKRLDNSQLWVLRMMLSRPDRKARPVVREKSEAAPLWRMLDPTFKGKVELLPCLEREGFNLEIVGNLRVPDCGALNAPLPQGKGNLGALGKFDVKTVPKKHAERKHAGKVVQACGRKKPEASVVPPLVPQVAGISRSSFRRYSDYMVVSDTHEGLSVLGGGAAAGETAARSKATSEKKRKPEEKAAAVGEKKRPRIQIKWASAVPQRKPMVAAEPQEGDFSYLFDVPRSPTRDAVADVGVSKEFSGPFVEVMPEPSARAEDTGKKPAEQIFDTGLGVLGGGAAAGETAAGSKAAGEKKRKLEEKAAAVGEKKRPRIQIKRASAVPQRKPMVAAEPQEGDFSYLFDVPRSPTRDAAADVGVSKEFSGSFVEVMPEPSARAEDTGKKPAEQIFDTVDSHDNLISPQDTDDLNLKFADAEKNKSPAAEKASDSACGGAAFEGPPIQPKESELEHYYRTYTEDRAILGGLGTQLEVNRARDLPRELRINQLSSMLVWSSIMANAIMEDYKVLGRKQGETARLRAEELIKAAREGAKQLKREKATFEQYKQTEEWDATAGLKQVRTLSKLLSDERKSWKEKLSNERKTWNESWAKQNETLFRAEVQNCKTMLVEITARATEAEARASEAVEARDRLVSSFNQLKADRDRMRDHGIGHIVKAILDAPENAASVDLIRQRARDVGFKAGYNRCISHMNILAQGKYTDERFGFHGVDTEARLDASLASYNDMSISALEQLDKCLDAEDYVDRLRLLYGDDDEEEDEEAGDDGTGGAGTSVTK
ncbi:hypothetical protein Hanom_Chr01g00051181 [Helianthus anomalus]